MLLEKLQADHNAFLAPMADVTDYAFRYLARKHGAGLTYTQMVSAEGIINNNFNTLRLATFSRDEKPIGVQLLGKKPEILGLATKELSKLKPNVIDFNAGCPVENVFAHKMGAYILQDPKRLGKMVKAMVSNSNGIPISIKIRLGAKDEINVLENAKEIEDNGASLIVIHARTRNERYDVDAHWEWLAKVKEKVSIPVIGNGSIFTAEDAVSMMNETGCDGVLIARGALGNPFIFNQIRALQKGKKYIPTLEEIVDAAILHLDLLMKEQDQIKSLDKAKKNIIWYFKYQKGIWNLIEKLFASKTFDEVKLVVNEHVVKLNDNYYKDDDNAEIKKKFNNRVVFWLAK